MIRKTEVRHRGRKKLVDKCIKNEAKFAILKTIFRATTYVSPEEIAEETGLTLRSVKSHLTRLYEWGYIWRLKEYRKRKNWFCYRYLKPKGFNVYSRYSQIHTINETLGTDFPFDYHLVIPTSTMERYMQIRNS